MCGIAGIYSPTGIKSHWLTVMSFALTHRGPDGYGYMLYSPDHGIHTIINKDLSASTINHYLVGFAHRRLSVIDLSEVNSQPMQDESGKYCIIYNGELYNYLDLREELEKLGYTFRSRGDTEVILRAYEAWGPRCMERFNGMWAFAILDRRDQSIILSRDRFGIKPLYYAIQNSTFYFASEIKGLLVLPHLRRRPNEKVVAKYLLTGRVDETEETFFEGLFQFPACHWAKLSLQENLPVLRTEPYWSLPTETYHGTEEEAIWTFKELFLDSLRIHSQSDVPIGTCLSGGLDSSSIICVSSLLRKKYQIPNYTHLAFGYCPSEEIYSEKKYMDIVAEETSSEMNHIDFTQEEFQKCLPFILEAQDEPFGSASIAAQWFVFKRARERGMTVMLDGQGSDEILAGYHNYFVTLALNLLTHRKLSQFFALRSQYQKEVGPFPLPIRYLPIGMIIGVLPQSLTRFINPATRFYRKMTDATTLVFTQGLIRNNPMDSFQLIKPLSLREELKVQLQSTCLPALLRYEDRNSMAHSIESRVPFLDYRLVEFLFTLPDDLKIRGVTTKYILRKAMEGILPEAIRNRKDKIGFKPNPALTFNFIGRCQDSIKKNDTEYEENWFEEQGIGKLMRSEGHSLASELLLWRILNTKLWIRKYWSE